MKNIIWKQPNDTIAVTSIFDSSDPQEHAQLIKSRGDVPADWIDVAYDWQDFPLEPQEAWRWDSNQIVIDPDALRHIKYETSVNAFQIRAALNQLDLRNEVEAVIATGSQDLKDAWQFEPKFNRFNEQVVIMGASLGMTDAQLDSLFDLAITL